MVEIIGRDPRTEKTLRIHTQGGYITQLEEIAQQSDLYLSAGLIDLQVNGFAGLDLNADELSVNTVLKLVDAMLPQGVTCFAPTVITSHEDKICNALQVIAKARSISPRASACIPYVHVEGPHISPLEGYRGAHPADAIRPPSIAEFDRWQRASSRVVGLVTLSPHYEYSAEYITHVVSSGVHVAIGHTHATPEQIRCAVDAGARLSTHLGNGIAAEIPRHRNAIWSQLADQRLTASVIADGQHLPQEVLQVILRAKGMQRTILVSDSVALAGMPPGTYNVPVGGAVELRPDGRLCMQGTELLAGSTATLTKCISNLVRTTETSLAEALAMATINPGRFCSNRGMLAVGASADIVCFLRDSKNEIQIADVWLSSEHVYARS